MSPYSYFVVQQPLGWMALLATTKGLRRLSLKPQPQEALDALGPSLELATLEPKVFESVLKQFDRYFKGQNDALDPIELDIEKSSPFFEASWEACRSIPPGETRSYSWLATAAGRPGAARAAGQAMARNKIALIIPCHRVIGSDGKLHGYGAGGLEVKSRLLALEQGFVFQ